MADKSAPGVLTVETVAELEGKSPRSIVRWADRRQKYEWIDVDGQHANGRPVRVLVPIPPAPTAEPEPSAIVAGGDPPAPALASPIHTGPMDIPMAGGVPDEGAMEAAGLTRQLTEYRRRMRVVAALRNALRGVKHGDKNIVYQAVAGQFNIKVGTLRKWYGLFREHGPAGLVYRKGLTTKGTHPSIPPDVQRVLLDLYAASPAQTVAHVRRHAGEPRIRELGLKPPHRRTFERFIADPAVLPELVRVLARGGKRAYQQLHEVKIWRSLEGVAPNDWLVADFRLFDNLVLVADGQGIGWIGSERTLPCPCNSGRQRKDCCSLRRLWDCVILDVASWAIVASPLCLTPSAQVVADALRQAILAHGVPRNFLSDNGSEFLSHRLAGRTLDLAAPSADDLEGQDRWPAILPEDVTETTALEALGIAHVRAIAFHAWSKPIESAFSAWTRYYERSLPGYVGGTTAKRPEALRRQTRAGYVLTAEEYAEVTTRLVADWNARPHGARKESPDALYAAAPAARPAPPPEALAFLLQARGEHIVRGGVIRVKDRRFMSPEIAQRSGSRFDIRYDEHEHCVYAYPHRRLPGDPPCFVATEQDPAKWGQWGGANRAAAQLSRAQRALVKVWAVEIKGAATPEQKDPFGAHALVSNRLLEAATAKRQQQLGAAKALDAAPEPVPRTIYDRPAPADGVERLLDGPAENPRTAAYAHTPMDDYIRALDADDKAGQEAASAAMDAEEQAAQAAPVPPGLAAARERLLRKYLPDAAELKAAEVA